MNLTKYIASIALLAIVAGCNEKHEPPQAVLPSSQPAPEASMASVAISSPMPSSLPSTDSDLVGLRQYINLPIEPSRVTWAMNKVTEPVGKLDSKDWSIVARMELNEKQLKVLRSVPLPNKVVKLPAYAIEPWMQDVIATKFKIDKSGHFYKPLGTMLSAEQFYNDPLITGAIYLITDTEILLFLQTE